MSKKKTKKAPEGASPAAEATEDVKALEDLAETVDLPVRKLSDPGPRKKPKALKKPKEEEWQRISRERRKEQEAAAKAEAAAEAEGFTSEQLLQQAEETLALLVDSQTVDSIRAWEFTRGRAGEKNAAPVTRTLARIRSHLATQS